MDFVGNAGLMKQLNRLAVLGLLREQGPLSRSDIARLLNISPSTVTRITSQLIEEGLLWEDETTQHSPGVGRPRTLLRFNHLAHLVIGVDVGGKKTAGCVADLRGNILYRKTVPSTPGGNEPHDLSPLSNLVQELVEAAPVSQDRIRGIGVGVPSIVPDSAGVIVWAPALGWRNKPLKHLLENDFGIQTFIENDVNLAALGESQYGIGRSVQNLMCIFVGTGIGGGLILNGELYRGHKGAAGEVGYMVPSPDLLDRSCDDTFGCLENLAAGPGVIARTRQAISGGRRSALSASTTGTPDVLTAKQVFQAARDGDVLAQETVTRTVDYLAQAIANVACTLNPEMIILGGGLTRSVDLLLEPIRERVRRVVPFPPKIVLTQLGDDAVLRGAIALAIKATREEISQ